VNTTYRMAPWADAMFAMDRQWWDTHIREVQETFAGARYSNNPLTQRHNVTRLPNSTFKTYGNSGAAAVNVAAEGGARRIILLGYDCQKTDGKAHWHGDHPSNLGNAGQIHRWAERFRELAADLRHLTIINASRATALTCFPRMDLEDALQATA
jgi:hypothetical protein